VFGLNPQNVVPDCHAFGSVGAVVDMLIEYSTFWLPGLFGIVTLFTVIQLCVIVPAVGAPLTGAPMPLATEPTVIVPVRVIAHVASVTLRAGILYRPTVPVLASCIVSVPEIGTVTTVALVRTAVPCVNPAGRLLTTKSAG